MMEDEHNTSSHVQKAVAFFKQAGLSRLLEKLRERYIELGRVGGQILLENSTPSERQYLASFLGKPPYRDASIRVRLTDVDRALIHSGFACTLPDLLTAFFPGQPLMTRQAQRAVHTEHQANFRTELVSIAIEQPGESRGRLWLLHGQHGQDWLFSHYKNEPVAEQEQQLNVIRTVVYALDQLPQAYSPQHLALFAQRISGDPHIFDPNTAAGRLFRHALTDLVSISTGHPWERNDAALTTESSASAVSSEPETTALTPLSNADAASSQNHAQALRLYANAGLLVDTISSSVAVFNLAGAVYHGGAPDPLARAAGERVLLLPLRQLLEWQSVLPTTTDIYMCENPQVFEEVIAGITPKDNGTTREQPTASESRSLPTLSETTGTAKQLPTLICTSGWPSTAALTLLDLLVAQSSANHLHYSGDFDLAGLKIAAYLMSHYPGRCHPWRFDPDSYTVAMHAEGVPATTADLDALHTLPSIFAPLVATMQEKGKWAYQEGITHLLVNDVKRYWE